MIIHGDCLDVMRGMEAGSVDSVVTDPPYGWRFMGRQWDYDIPTVEVWQEVLRVLKPGGHLLCFCGPRTQHRMAVNIEDAGFSIRDMLAWVYGSGFPKSLDVSKAIDKAAGAEREVVGSYAVTRDLARNGRKGDEAISPVPVSGTEVSITAPATDAAREAQGWGTALKPALEPITMARKPLEGTVEANWRKWGTGALNIDGCRVDWAHDGEAAEVDKRAAPNARGKPRKKGDVRVHNSTMCAVNVSPDGRWPANLIHDGSEEVVAGFPETTTNAGTYRKRGKAGIYSPERPEGTCVSAGDAGSAARFFYCAKASKAERGAANNHPTVKPLALMQYLCRLVTPKGGTVLDPFAGSGSTGKAALAEGFRFIGIEREAEYVEIAKRRLEEARDLLTVASE